MPLGIQVNCTFAAILLFLLAPQSANSGTTASPANQQGAEAASAASQREIPMVSDREKAGPRGPVEECTVEMIAPPGSTSHAWRMITATKYDPDGRIYQHSYINNDGSKGVESLTYDTEGHLLREMWDAQNGTSDTIYTYDVQGRLISITGVRDRSTTFEYDDQGRKTRIVKSELKASSTDNRGGFGVSIDSDDLFIAPPAGGMVRTSFNERDQATESQVYAASGDVASRLTRTYDAKGRVTELSYVIENLALLLPPEARERLAAEPGAAEEMEREFVMVRISYSYDEKGRVAEKHEHTGVSRETTTKITYNDHGDEMEEIATASGDLNPRKDGDGTNASSGAPQPLALPDEHSDVRFNYQYDSFGNWIEKRVSFRSGVNESFTSGTIEHRTITYY
jgi:YD repeat-containing protein